MNPALQASHTSPHSAEYIRSTPQRRLDPRRTTRSPAMRRVLDRLELFASIDDVILLEGETGVGKTLLAELLHAWSPRRRGTFHTVDLGSIDKGLSGSHLFGHVPGAYSGAQGRRAGAFISAQGGTLFLDEISKCPKTVQQKLLRAIEQGEVTRLGEDRATPIDVRVVLASNANLQKRVKRGKFLPDLLARISAFRVRIPSLRERPEDIPLLVDELLALHCARYDRAVPEVEPALLSELSTLSWPYNLRQLDRAVRRLVVEGQGARLLTLKLWRAVQDDLLLGAPVTAATRRAPPTTDQIREAVRRMQRPTLRGLADALGVARNTLRRHLPEDVRRQLGVNGSLRSVDPSGQGPAPLDHGIAEDPSRHNDN